MQQRCMSRYVTVNGVGLLHPDAVRDVRRAAPYYARGRQRPTQSHGAATVDAAPLACAFHVSSYTPSLRLPCVQLLHVFCHRGLPWGVQTTLERMPFLRGIQRRHRRHHGSERTGGGKFNYAITNPFYDLCFGTLNNEADDA